MKTYVAASGTNSNKLSLKINEMTLVVSEVEENVEVNEVCEEGVFFSFYMPPGAPDNLTGTGRTLYYRMMNYLKKIAKVPIYEVEETLDSIAKKILIINRAKLFETVQTHFTNEETSSE